MSDYLEKPTLEERLAGYLESGDFQNDIGCLVNEYECRGGPIPPADQLWAEAAAKKCAWLEKLSVCEAEGHQFQETAAAENGVGDLSCDRCGMTDHC